MAALAVAAMGFAGCRGEAPAAARSRCEGGARLVEIALRGPVASDDAELSGLAWHGDDLVLLPQFPERFAGPAGGDGALFAVDRGRIEAALSTGAPVTPRPLAFDAGRLADNLAGWGGFEAVSFVGDVAYLLVETEEDGVGRGYVVRGRVEAGGALHLDLATLVRIAPQVELSNLAYESVVATADRVLALHEVNARRLNRRAVARVFAPDLVPRPDLEMPDLEHRVTDATAVDAVGRFWIVNYRWADDRELHPPGTPRDAVERFLEVQVAGNRIVRTARPSLDVCPVGAGRNWEGVVRLGDRGLLVVTDRHPRTLLAFVAFD